MFTSSLKTTLVTLQQLRGRQLGLAATWLPAPPQSGSGTLTEVFELPESNNSARKLGSRFTFDKQIHFLIIF